MAIKKFFAAVCGTKSRLSDDELYSAVWTEIEEGRLDPSAKARAFEEGLSSGSEFHALYIKHRLKSLKNQARVKSAAAEEEYRAKKATDAVPKSSSTACAVCGSQLSFFSQKGPGAICGNCTQGVLAVAARLTR